MPKVVNNGMLNNLVFKCPRCGKGFSGQGWAYVISSEKPSLKDLVLSETFFKTRCPYCRKLFQQEYEFLYVDSVNKALIALHFKPLLVYTDNYFLSKFKYLPPDATVYKRRVVQSFHDLSEKAMIFEYGLDDRIIQFLKDMIRFDYDEKGEKAPSEIRFAGLNSNFKQTELHFKLTIDQKDQSYFWDENHYQFCSRLIEKYAEDFHKKDWLVINNYFPKYFMELAYEKYRKEEFDLLISKGESIRKQLCIHSRMIKKPGLTALINSSRVTLTDCTLYVDFPSELLASRMRGVSPQLAAIAEEVIGFKPDIVCRVISAKRKS